MGGGGEEFCVGVDVGGGGGRAHESHVMERGEKDAAVESIEVEEAFEFEIGGGGGFAAVAGRFCGEGVFGACDKLDYVPGKMVRADFGGHAIVEALGKRDHAFECGRGEDVFEGGAHGG